MSGYRKVMDIYGKVTRERREIDQQKYAVLQKDISTFKNKIKALEKFISDPESKVGNSGYLLNDEDNKTLFFEITEKEVQQIQDRVIWKTYSKRGGIYDIFTDIENTVEHPSVNAFDFDEDEGQYVIFITFHNTYLTRLESLYDEMCNEYKGCHESIRQGMQKEREELQERSSRLQKAGEELEKHCSGLQKAGKELEKRCRELQKQYQEPEKGLKERVLRTKTIVIKKIEERNTGAVGENREEELKKDLDYLESQLMKVEKYCKAVEDYNKQLQVFNEKCDTQKMYTPKYITLYELLHNLCKVQEDGNRFHVLTVSPCKETGYDGYMETAHAYCREIVNIKNEYPL